MSTEWITDRLPTGEDADQFGDVWVTLGNGFVCEWNWRSIKPQMPWRPTNKPAPYVKPKRWTVEFDSDYNVWFAYDRRSGSQCTNVFAQLGRNELDAAQRIEDLFNEVMP
jgi:hypothetical protein